MASPSGWTVVLAACFAVTPGVTLLTPRSVAGSVPAGPPGGRGGSPLTSAAAPQGPQARLSVVDWNAYDERDTDGPGTYSFGYEIEDPSSGNTQFRQEERFANGTVVGSYGLVEPDGNVRVVSYVADALGYRVRVENSLRKSENFPRTTTTTTTSTGRPRRPEWSTSDRLLGGTVPQASAVEVFRRQQQQLEQLPPLQWAVQSLQDGRRAPVQEQRLRPASAPRRYASEMEMEYVAQQQQQQLQQQQQQQQQYLQEQQQLQQKRLQQQQHHLQEQQQRQQQQQRLDRGVGQVYAPVEQQQQYGRSSMPVQYEDVSNSLAPEVEYYRREEAVDNRRSSGEWSSKPIVVRRQLPPIPLLDKLIYQ